MLNEPRCHQALPRQLHPHPLPPVPPGNHHQLHCEVSPESSVCHQTLMNKGQRTVRLGGIYCLLFFLYSQGWHLRQWPCGSGVVCHLLGLLKQIMLCFGLKYLEFCDLTRWSKLHRPFIKEKEKKTRYKDKNSRYSWGALNRHQSIWYLCAFRNTTSSNHVQERH